MRSRTPHAGWGIKELKAALVEIWDDEISPQLFKEWTDEIPEGLQAVVSA
jgi:hypothetical protein